MKCIQCRRPFLKEDYIASISGSIMGDEYTDSSCLCPVFRVYTMVSRRDNFTGVKSMNLYEPIEKQKGNARVELIWSRKVNKTDDITERL
jgi:hypothetical protein